MDNKEIGRLEQKLSSFDSDDRKVALNSLNHSPGQKVQELQNVNLHFHSFNSYNAENWSPSRIAWESKTKALYAAGIIDFDVLTGLEEFYSACELLGVRSCVGMETRAFLNEYASKEIDSPGEPGVSYIAGTGFCRVPEKDSPQVLALEKYSQKAEERNLVLIRRINEHVPDIALSFGEVTPLTPAGNATERHIITAYIDKSFRVFKEKNALIAYWALLLESDPGSAGKLIGERHRFEDVVRTRFAKRGGFGYVQPSSHTFPPVEEFFAFVKACGAIPMESWLDGTSEGEKDGKALLELSRSKGAAALNLIPDRNWNIADNDVKALKTRNLRAIIDTAVSMDMPIHIGTEMNKKGLPFVDDLNGADLNVYKEIFMNGARICVGHTLLGRFADFTYVGEEAESEYPGLKERNSFFASVGALPPVNTRIADALRDAGNAGSFSLICDSAKKGEWIISNK
ncbi:MAG: hypothetical protein GY790_16855 [Bacteroidetes bacterium]|nr:hypothetical protein [Bacteroidota bacterium]